MKVKILITIEVFDFKDNTKIQSMSNNVIVSPHYLSSEAGNTVFKLGGNAIDAAIAVNIVKEL